MFISSAVLSQTSGCVFDVGAHHGAYARLLLEKDPSRQIFAFEPVLKQVEIACQSLASFENVCIVPMGLSDSIGTELVYLSRKHPDTAGTVRFTHDFDADGEFEEIVCNFTTGDAFCAEQMIERIALLKIDVEGMEARVLRGFKEKLSSGRIETIQFEHGPTHAETGDTVRTLTRTLNGYGYTVWAIFPNGLREFSSPGADAETFRGRNLFAALTSQAAKYGSLIVGSC